MQKNFVNASAPLQVNQERIQECSFLDCGEHSWVTAGSCFPPIYLSKILLLFPPSWGVDWG